MIDLMIYDDRIATTTLQVAEHFGKEHAKVLRRVKKLKQEIGQAKGGESSTGQGKGQAKNEPSPENGIDIDLEFDDLFYFDEYENRQGKLQPMYVMGRDGFLLLVMGFSGAKALKVKLAFIEAFNRMEEALYDMHIDVKETQTERLRKQIVKGMRERVAYECPFDELEDVTQDRYIIAIAVLKSYYGMKHLTYTQAGEIRRAMKVLGVWRLDELFYKCYERGALHYGYLKKVIDGALEQHNGADKPKIGEI